MLMVTRLRVAGLTIEVVDKERAPSFMYLPRSLFIYHCVFWGLPVIVYSQLH